jgi:hypothetical protein
MAIQKFDSKAAVTASDFEGFFIALNNGDKAALDQVIARWNFKDVESFLKFVLAVMIKGEGNKLFIQIGGAQTGISPADTLLR